MTDRFGGLVRTCVAAATGRSRKVRLEAKSNKVTTP